MGSAEILLFGGLFMAAYSVYSFVASILAKSSESENLLSWATGDQPVQSKSPLINLSRSLVHQFTLRYAAKVTNVRYRKRVDKLLLTAGMSRELNTNEFIGLQILWAILPSGFLVFLGLAGGGDIPWPLVIFLIPVGAYGPFLHANSEKRLRETSVRADLPFFADLLALSTEAGLDFISAIQRIVDKAQSSVLAEELGIVLRDIKLGASRADALKGMASRLDIPEVTSFVAVLVDADATGASIANVLKDQSTQIRLERFVRAEKAGARASQAILLPLMIFILPAVFIIVFGPVVVQFVSGGN